MKTYSAKPAEVEKKWFLVDAEGMVLGRLASLVALRLRGKHKPGFTPHVDCGDNIIIINAGKVVLTGGSKGGEKFHWHTGYPGGIKSVAKGKLLESHPDRLVMNAVRRMLPKTKLGGVQLTNLRVYGGAEHPHEAQQPTVLDLAGLNKKNKRS